MKTLRKRSKTPATSEEADWTVIYCSTPEEVEECISDPSVIWPILWRTCLRLIDEDRESLPSIEIRCLDMVGSVWVTVRKGEVESTLNKMMNWRLSREEYEECATIRDLIDRIGKGPSSVKKSADLDER
jgi:hypothetical protein